MNAQKNRLTETVLLRTHNIFWLINKKINFEYALLCREALGAIMLKFWFFIC